MKHLVLSSPSISAASGLSLSINLRDRNLNCDALESEYLGIPRSNRWAAWTILHHLTIPFECTSRPAHFFFGAPNKHHAHSPFLYFPIAVEISPFSPIFLSSPPFTFFSRPFPLSPHISPSLSHPKRSIEMESKGKGCMERRQH